MAIEKTIGKRIHTRRKSLQMTQDELAGLANLDRSYISEIENGRVNFSIPVLGTSLVSGTYKGLEYLLCRNLALTFSYYLKQ